MSSNQEFIDQWGHLWDDMGDVDRATAKPCFDIHSRERGVDVRQSTGDKAPEQQGAHDER